MYAYITEKIVLTRRMKIMILLLGSRGKQSILMRSEQNCV